MSELGLGTFEVILHFFNYKIHVGDLKGKDTSQIESSLKLVGSSFFW